MKYEHIGKAAARRRGKLSEQAQREWDANEASVCSVSCLFCDWSLAGPLKEARLAALKHRVAEHPERPARIKRRGSGFVAAKATGSSR